MRRAPAANVRPISPELRALQVPAQLADIPCWCVWNLEHHANEPKPRKVPYYARGGRRYGAQGTPEDLAKLVTFADAKEDAVRRGMTGVGFVPAAAEDYSGLDFDNCVKGGVIDPLVLNLVQNTYHELSPSATGVRAFVKGKLGNGKSKSTEDQFGFETFSTTGFVTVTGNMPDHVRMLGYENHIAPVSDELRAYCEQRFKFSGQQKALEEDFTLGYEPKLNLSHEEMEQLLDQLDPDMERDHWIRVGLALHHEAEGDDTGFYLWNDWSATGGKYPGEDGLREQWDSFDRRQGVRRKNVTMAAVKWMVTQNDLRLTPTPAQMVERAERIAKSAEGSLGTGPDFSGKYPAPHISELAHRKPPGWWAKGVLPKAELAIIYGASGSGKSFAVLDLLAHISLGRPWRGRKCQKANVLLVVAEGAGGYGARAQALADHLGIDPSELNISVITAAPNILDTDDVTEIIATAMAVKADIIAWDTLAQVTPGANENSAEDMGRALNNLKTVHVATEAMNLLIHHAGKDASKGARGWSGNKAAADVEIEVVRNEDGSRLMRLTKMKDGADDLQFGFKLDIVTLGTDEDGDPITTCVVSESEVRLEPAGERKSVKRRGRLETHVLEMIATVGKRDTIPLSELVTLCAEALPRAEEDKRDTRRQVVTRAIQTLSREKDGALKVEGSIVVLYE